MQAEADATGAGAAARKAVDAGITCTAAEDVERLEPGREKMERVLGQMIARLGPTHLDVLAAQHRLGSLLALSSNDEACEAALRHFRAAIDGYSAVLSPEHEKTTKVIREFQFCLARRANHRHYPGAGTAGTGHVANCSSDDDGQQAQQDQADGVVEDIYPVPDSGANARASGWNIGHEDLNLPPVQFVIPDNSARVSRLSLFFLFLMVAPGMVATLLMLIELCPAWVGEGLHSTCVKSGLGLCTSYYDQLVEIYMSTNQQARVAIQICRAVASIANPRWLALRSAKF